MNLVCPLCKSAITIDDNLAGQSVQCPKCKGQFQTPMRFIDPDDEPYRLAPDTVGSAAEAAAVGGTLSDAVITNSLTGTMSLPAANAMPLHLADARPPEETPTVAANAEELLRVKNELAQHVEPPAPAIAPAPTPGTAAVPAIAPAPAPAIAPAPTPGTTPTPTRSSTDRITARDDVEPQLSVQLPREFFGYAVPVLLALALILSFFSWNGASPAGYSVYYQNAWGALFARFGYEPTGESVLQLKGPLGESIKSSWWMLFYLPCVVIGLVLAVANLLIPQLNLKLPPTVQQVWPYRTAILGGVCVLALLALLAQSFLGFGLENAITGKILDKHAEILSKVEIPSEVQKARMAYAAELAPYQVGRTWAFTLSVLCQILALVSLGLDTWMVQRGNKPRPRLELLW